MTPRRLLFATILAGAVLLPVVALAQTSSPSGTCESVQAAGAIVLNIRVPGLPTCTKTIDNKSVEFSTATGFPQYLVTFYTWFAGAAGTLAVFMCMYAGFHWITAGGNAGRISEAKDILTSAVVGLILLLGSYVLLNTISPTLVNFKALDLGSAVSGISLGDCFQQKTASSVPWTPIAVASAAQCPTGAGACSPAQNAKCGAAGGGCGCTIQCADDETWVNFANCATVAQGIAGIATSATAANPGDSTVIDRPVTWGNVYSEYLRETGRQPTKEGITSWLTTAAAGFVSARGCLWLFATNPVAATYTCATPAIVLGMWNALGTQLPQSNELIVGGNRTICCQKKSDPLTCTARAAAPADPGGKATVSGRCETDVSASYLPCRNRTTSCGTPNPSGVDIRGNTGCYGVFCPTGQACIIDYKTGKRSVPSFGGCKTQYDQNGVYNSNPFSSAQQCAALSGGTVSQGATVGTSCGAGGTCVFINGYVGKWYESSYYRPGKCDNTGANCVDNGQCGGGTCVGGGYRTSTYDTPEGTCPGDQCAWERGGVQCYANQ